MSLRIASAAVAPDPASYSRPAPRAPAGVSAFDSDVVDVTFEPVGQHTITQWVASPADLAAEVTVALATERRGELGDHGHRHQPGACGFCRRAAAAYR